MRAGALVPALGDFAGPKDRQRGGLTPCFCHQEIMVEFYQLIARLQGSILGLGLGAAAGVFGFVGLNSIAGGFAGWAPVI